MSRLVKPQPITHKPIHTGPTLNNILPTVTNASHMTIIDLNSVYHSLKQEMCVDLGGKDSPDYYLEWPQEVTCSSKN